LNATIKQWEIASSADIPNAADFGLSDSTIATNDLLPDLQLQTLNLKNIFVRYDNEASNINTKFEIKNLVGNIDELDLNKEIVSVKEVKLGETDAQVFLGKSNSAIKDISTQATLDTSSINWKVTVQKLA